jgi:hypothetical protein
MTSYYARIVDAKSGSEASYEFNAPDDLLQRTGDEIVGIFGRGPENTLR